MIDESLTQRAFTTILEHFVANGRAPHYAELADALDIGPEEAREVQRAAAEAEADALVFELYGIPSAMPQMVDSEYTE